MGYIEMKPSGRLTWDDADFATESAVTRMNAMMAESGRDTIAGLFGEALAGHTVAIRARGGGISGSAVFLATPSSAIAGRMEPMIVKIGAIEKMAAEHANYVNLVVRHLPTGGFATLEASRTVRAKRRPRGSSWGALFYRSVGRSSIDEYIAYCVQRGQLAQACQSVDSMLGLLGVWQSSIRVLDSRPLSADELFGFGPAPWADRFFGECERLAPHLPPDAVQLVPRFWEAGALRPQRTFVSSVHGDLHHDNIRIVGRDRVALIDFGSCTNEGHFMRDLVTFEAHMMVRSLAPSDLEGAMRFYESQDGLFGIQLMQDPFRSSAVSALFEPILHVRRYAFSCLARGDLDLWPQYAFGLLRHMIRLTMRDRDATTGESDLGEGQRWLAAQLACDLAQHLDIQDGCVRFRDRLAVDSDKEFRFLDPHGILNDHGLPPLVGIRPVRDDAWGAFARSLLRAARIDIIGVAPWPLMKELLAQAMADALTRRSSRVAQPFIRYVTTPQPTASRERITRWEDANKSVTNLVNILGGYMLDLNDLKGETTTMDRLVRCDPAVSNDCLMRVIWDDHDTRIIAVLGTQPSFAEDSFGYFMTEIIDLDGRLGRWFEETCSAAVDPVRVNEVNCEPRIPGIVAPEELADIDLPIKSLSPFGSGLSESVRPIAIVIPTFRHFSKEAMPHVLMVVRHAMTDADTWGRRSFPSSRVRSQDLLESRGLMATPLAYLRPEAELAWMRQELFGGHAGSVQIADVKVAGRRALLERTDLEASLDRFAYHGLITTAPDEQGRQLAYGVVTIELTLDEVERCRRASQRMFNNTVDLVDLSVDVKGLLEGTVEANRFTTEYRGWMADEVFPGLAPSQVKGLPNEH